MDTMFFKEIWEALTDETLVCVAEQGNSHNRNAVAFEKGWKMIGHLG